MRLLEWRELQEWQSDNEFILTSYRPTSYNYRLPLESAFHSHNETLNIWSHLLGAAGFFLALWRSLHFWQISHADVPVLDQGAVAIYYVSVVIRFFLSSTFHIFANHSQGMHQYGNQPDYLGIMIVIWGSCISSTYLGFNDELMKLSGYWLMSTIAAMGCGIFTIHSSFRTRAYRSMRMLTYLALAASAFIAFAHGICHNGWRVQNSKSSIDHFIGLACFQATGTLIYGLRIPERWFPRTFDIFGSSHQIMHVLVICGAITYERGLLIALQCRAAAT